MLEKFGRKLLSSFAAETAHDMSIKLLNSPFSLFAAQKPMNNAVELFGVTFQNPIGLAAGFDKNADAVKGLARLGFGFLEVGTVTPKPQKGNEKPRLFRLPHNQAIINRMGFNNKGVDYLVKRIEKCRPAITLGINIGKNKNTSNDKAIDDYVYCLRKSHHLADYITINISSPNTIDLRQLQESKHLANLLQNLKNEQLSLAKKHKKYTPIVVKIAPDQANNTTIEMAKTIKNCHMDGIICTNTTIERKNLKKEFHSNETGGLSGKPLLARSNEILRLVRKTVGADFALIGVGGILTAGDAMSKIAAGANLVQIFTGFIYQGTQLITTSNQKIIAATNTENNT